MLSILDYGAPVNAAQFVANRVANTVQVAFGNLLQTYMSEFDAIWRPGSAANYTTADVLAAFGPYATDLFQRSAATRDFLLAQVADCVPVDYQTPLVSVTFNQDGTVTLQGS